MKLSLEHSALMLLVIVFMCVGRGRKGWRELSRRPAAQVGVTANPGRDGEPQTQAVYRDWRRQTEGQRGKAQGRYYLVYTEESEAEFK